MSVPFTPMLVPPPGDPDPLGVGMTHTDLIKGLRRINSNLCIPDSSTWTSWYDGCDFGMTSVWDGNPRQAGVRKIVSFHLGLLPEWTQAAPAGIIRRGWRSVLEKCIKARVVTRSQVEREFKINLDYQKESTKFCRIHLMDGERVSTEGNASGLCDEHEIAQLNCRKAKEHRKESEWLRSRFPDPKRTPSPVKPVYF